MMMYVILQDESHTTQECVETKYYNERQLFQQSVVHTRTKTERGEQSPMKSP